LANTLPGRLLPERPSLDGYTVREVSLDQVVQLFKSMGQQHWTARAAARHLTWAWRRSASG
jgi:hypothetical protein